MEKVLLGKTKYARKWHILRDGKPVCGYTSYTWLSFGETVEVPLSEVLKEYSLCKACKEKVLSKKKLKKKQKNPK